MARGGSQIGVNLSPTDRIGEMGFPVFGRENKMNKKTSQRLRHVETTYINVITIQDLNPGRPVLSRFCLEGTPELAYDDAKRYAAEQAAVQKTGISNILFLYPPVYLLLCAPLALLPYLPALVAFQVMTLCLYLFVVRGILA